MLSNNNAPAVTINIFDHQVLYGFLLGKDDLISYTIR